MFLDRKNFLRGGLQITLRFSIIKLRTHRSDRVKTHNLLQDEIPEKARSPFFLDREGRKEEGFELRVR